MSKVNEKKLAKFERYQITAKAIGLIELFGNIRPDNKQVRMAERLVRALGLSWEACENQSALLRALKDGRNTLANH